MVRLSGAVGRTTKRGSKNERNKKIFFRLYKIAAADVLHRHFIARNYKAISDSWLKPFVEPDITLFAGFIFCIVDFLFARTLMHDCYH